ncbi:MAG: dienelactone hydrolase family protein [Pseudomonadota bacterium]
MLPLLEGTGARAAQIAPGDARLAAGYVTYKGATGRVRAYRARPTGSARLPAILVIHQNKGLTAHIEDVVRRAALKGYIVLAPDALSPAGGAPTDPDKAKALVRGLDKAATLKNFLAAVSYLKAHPESTGKVGSVGFCWGGAMSN